MTLAFNSLIFRVSYQTARCIGQVRNVTWLLVIILPALSSLWVKKYAQASTAGYCLIETSIDMANSLFRLPRCMMSEHSSVLSHMPSPAFHFTSSFLFCRCSAVCRSEKGKRLLPWNSKSVLCCQESKCWNASWQATWPVHCQSSPENQCQAWGHQLVHPCQSTIQMAESAVHGDW